METGRFESGHDLMTDGRGGLGRAVEAAVEQRQSTSGRGGLRALGVEVLANAVLQLPELGFAEVGR
ncbi:hypothetical protein [Lentzea sp. NPDC004782]|uniref:hypothetical protein n=1 Tax=Lentzea sp. NPDC004782 TaxID=3154458 RepID=UPI00339EFD8F